MRTAALACAIAALSVLSPRRTTGQLWLEAIGSAAHPPADPARTASFYNLLGSQAHGTLNRLQLDAGAYLGLGTREQDGRWITGSLTAGQAWRWGAHTFALDADVFGLRYSRPFSYSAGLANAHASVGRTFAQTELSLAASSTRGRWSSRYELQGPLGQPLLKQDSSGSLGLDALEFSAIRPLSGGRLSLLARTFRDAPFSGHGSVRFSKTVNDFDLSVHGAVLSGGGSSLGGGGVSVGRSVGDRWYATLDVEQQLPDLILSTISSFGAALSIRWRVAEPKAAPLAAVVSAVPARPRVVTVEPGRGSSKVAFQLPSPSAKSVSVVGSFSNWEPRAMTQEGTAWMLSLRLPPGSHQFAFLVDGEWFLPGDAPGVIDDGFGRKNATVVVERL